LCRRAATTLLLISALVLAAALLVVLVHQFSLAARQIILVGKERQGNRVKAMPADSFVAPKTTAGFDTYASETVSLFRREDKFRAYAALGAPGSTRRGSSGISPFMEAPSLPRRWASSGRTAFASLSSEIC
jgi:hypothetical protein